MGMGVILAAMAAVGAIRSFAVAVGYWGAF